MKIRSRRLLGGAVTAAALTLAPWTAGASSHREAPYITENPKVDGTDLYMFNSYEPGRAGYVTLIANYLPLQDAYGGPNYFTLDPDAIYEIHIDNSGDGVEDLTFQFDFAQALGNGGAGITIPIGPAGSEMNIAIPLATAGSLDSPVEAAQNIIETYGVNLIRMGRRTGVSAPVLTFPGLSPVFRKPFDNAGLKTIANYPAYAAQFVTEFDVPGCVPTGVGVGTHSRVFVGQRKEGFAVNLGQIFDLINLDLGGSGGVPPGMTADLLGPADQGANIVDDKNITSLAIEVPASCLTAAGGAQPIIAGWTTASMRQARVINPTGTFTTPAREGGPWAQVSRLGMVLVNEVVIGLPDKNKWNGSQPSADIQFAPYVTNPTLPELVEIVFGAQGMLAPTAFPRADLVAAFLNGVPGATKFSDTLFEAIRLNTAVPATPAATQSPLGAATCFDPPASNAVGPTLNLNRAGCDAAGFPNGRRPGDDTVDIALRVAMGFLLPQDQAPARAAPIVDGAAVDSSDFLTAFPYLQDPIPGSP